MKRCAFAMVVVACGSAGGGADGPQTVTLTTPVPALLGADENGDGPWHVRSATNSVDSLAVTGERYLYVCDDVSSTDRCLQLSTVSERTALVATAYLSGLSADGSAQIMATVDHIGADDSARVTFGTGFGESSTRLFGSAGTSQSTTITGVPAGLVDISVFELAGSGAATAGAVLAAVPVGAGSSITESFDVDTMTALTTSTHTIANAGSANTFANLFSPRAGTAARNGASRTARASPAGKRRGRPTAARDAAPRSPRSSRPARYCADARVVRARAHRRDSS